MLDNGAVNISRTSKQNLSSLEEGVMPVRPYHILQHQSFGCGVLHQIHILLRGIQLQVCDQESESQGVAQRNKFKQCNCSKIEHCTGN